jgi:hypothetical protein
MISLRFAAHSLQPSAILLGVSSSLQKTEELGFTRLAQPLYFHDLAPYDCFPFEYLKKELNGKNFSFQNEVISVVRAVLTKIPIQTF